MPNINRNSIEPLQHLGDMINRPVMFINIYPNSAIKPGRLTQLGTLLVCFERAPGWFPVAAAYKVYGHGVALNKDPIWPGVTCQLWMRWFLTNQPFIAQWAD